MFALYRLDNGVVVDTAKETFPVHRSMRWAECDESVVANTWAYRDDAFVEVPAPPPPSEDERPLKAAMVNTALRKLVKANPVGAVYLWPQKDPIPDDHRLLADVVAPEGLVYVQYMGR